MTYLSTNKKNIVAATAPIDVTWQNNGIIQAFMYPYQHVNIFSLNYLMRVNIISLTLSACCVFIIKGDSSLHNTHTCKQLKTTP